MEGGSATEVLGAGAQLRILSSTCLLFSSQTMDPYLQQLYAALDALGQRSVDDLIVTLALELEHLPALLANLPPVPVPMPPPVPAPVGPPTLHRGDATPRCPHCRGDLILTWGLSTPRIDGTMAEPLVPVPDPECDPEPPAGSLNPAERHGKKRRLG